MAVYVTKYLSAIWHAILDNFRPITIWVLDLYIFYYLYPGTGACVRVFVRTNVFVCTYVFKCLMVFISAGVRESVYKCFRIFMYLRVFMCACLSMCVSTYVCIHHFIQYLHFILSNPISSHLLIVPFLFYYITSKRLARDGSTLAVTSSWLDCW